jgi:hypothetical protein
MKQLTIMNKISNKLFYYTFMLIRHPLFLYLLIMLLYILFFNYFFADPVLCDSIDKLKNDLRGDLASLKDACHDYETFSNIYNIQKLRILHFNTISDIN